MIVEARPAATVILVRDGEGEGGIETFVMCRAPTMAFAPGMHVFPGGRVDPDDFAESVVFDGDDARHLAERASTDVAGIAALYACAVRETAEETGVVLGNRDDEGRLVIRSDVIPLADHWVTPEIEGRRYDVRFFAAELPAGQKAGLTTTEADEAWWVRPREALARFGHGDMPMLPPTEATLRYLARFDAVGPMLAAAGARPVVPLLPRRLVDEAGHVRWAMVHARTGEVIQDGISEPHTRETDGFVVREFTL